jgi:hypothetical protein
MSSSTGHDRGMVNFSLMNMPLHPTALSCVKLPENPDTQAMLSLMEFMEENPSKKLTKALNSFIAFRCEFVGC